MVIINCSLAYQYLILCFSLIFPPCNNLVLWSQSGTKHCALYLRHVGWSYSHWVTVLVQISFYISTLFLLNTANTSNWRTPESKNGLSSDVIPDAQIPTKEHKKHATFRQHHLPQVTNATVMVSSENEWDNILNHSQEWLLNIQWIKREHKQITEKIKRVCE